MLGLADARQISSKMVVTAPAFQQVLPKMDGSRGIDEIVAEVGQGLQAEMLQNFVAQLDDAGLIEGPTFEKLKVEMHAQFDNAETLPPGRTADIADNLVIGKVGQDATDEQKNEQGPELLAELLDEYMNKALEKAEDPSFDALPAAVIVPQGDYQLMWPNYAVVYGRMRVVDTPDRVLVLGSNSFGEATGVCGCNKSFESPMGISQIDTELLEKIQAKLTEQGGEELANALLANRYDHEREHSIELQIPWIQRVFGEKAAPGKPNGPKVFGALIHDPAVNNGESYDGNGVGLQAFVDAVKAALAELGGTTLIICAADLSHVGPAFGDNIPLIGESDDAKANRDKVVNTDKELIKPIEENRPDDLITAMAWQQNVTRWNSAGCMVAASKIAEADNVRLINYLATMDQQGSALVSSVAMVLS